jgi:hypothetical protein
MFIYLVEVGNVKIIFTVDFKVVHSVHWYEELTLKRRSVSVLYKDSVRTAL